MHNSFRFVLLAIAVLMSCGLALGQTDTVTVLHMNDTHSNLAPIGPRDPGTLKGSLGGIARAATLIGMTKMTEPNVLALHAGDLFVGDIFFNAYFGVPELQILLAGGLDAMGVGNHEFDLTPSTLMMALDTAFAQGSFPLLSANVNLEATEVQPLKKYIQPYTIKQLGSTTVGIFGLTTPATNVLSQPLPAFVDSDFVSPAAAMVDTLTARGCRVIICLSHLGSYYDYYLAQTVPGIHAIVGGHDHFLMEEPVAVVNPLGDTTWILQAGSFYLNMGKLRLTVTDTTVRFLDYTMVDLDGNIPEEPGTAAVIEGLMTELEAAYQIPFFSQKITYAAEDFKEVADSLVTEGYRDTPIGNLVTDAFRWLTKTDIAIEVGGSTAQVLYRGPVVPADLFRVVGYGFNMDNTLGYRLATFQMTGAALFAGLEFGLSGIELDDEFFIQASGLTYSYVANRPDSLRLHEAFVNGEPLNPDSTYSVTANEFVPMFLSFIGIPYENVHIMPDTTEFQALLWYVSQFDTLRPAARGRIISPVERLAAPSPETFELHQNFPNPFNPSTTICYDIPATSRVRLAVHDILGREVALLLDGEVRPGSYRTEWNAGDFSSGVYFLRLQADEWSTVKRMVLLK